MKPVEEKITTGFFAPRPLSDPGKHIHGAIDIGVRSGSYIRAPEKGWFFYWSAFREKASIHWPSSVFLGGRIFPWRNYFYDTFGGVIVVESHDKHRIHIITHSFLNQLFNPEDSHRRTHTYEEGRITRFPLHAVYTEPRRCKMGAIIGFVGNAGHSTGPHIHWEIHPRGWQWVEWGKRINPEEWEEK